MESLAFPFTARDQTVDSGSRRAIVCASLALLFSLAIPLTAAYAQNPAKMSGTVSCVETVDLGGGIFDSSTHVYEVNVVGSVIEDRWGPGNDVNYGGRPSIRQTNKTIDLNKSAKGLTEIFWTMPANEGCKGENPPFPDEVPTHWYEFEVFDFCLPSEQEYSETGNWTLRIQKDQLDYSGTSFAVMHYKFAGESEWLDLSAQCTWDMTESLVGD